MCEWGDTVDVLVPIPADLSHDGKRRLASKPIDRCIAPIVEGLTFGRVDTRSSCCGHGKGIGNIVLEDGREILILPALSREAASRVHEAIHGEGGLVAAVLGGEGKR